MEPPPPHQGFSNPMASSSKENNNESSAAAAASDTSVTAAAAGAAARAILEMQQLDASRKDGNADSSFPPSNPQPPNPEQVVVQYQMLNAAVHVAAAETLSLMVQNYSPLIQLQEREAQYQHEHGEQGGEEEEEEVPPAVEAELDQAASVALDGPEAVAKVELEQHPQQTQEQPQGQPDMLPHKDDVILEGKSSSQNNRKFDSMATQIAKKYRKAKKGYKDAALEIIYNSMVLGDKARFLRRTKDGKKWKLLRKRTVQEMMKRDFSKTCNLLVKRQRGHERDEIDKMVARAEAEAYGPAAPKKKAAEPKQPAPTRQQQVFLSLASSLIPTKTHHCVLDLATAEHGMIFSFAKALSNNSTGIESLELHTSDMSLAVASALAWGIESCGSLKQIKFRFGSSYQEHYGHVLLKGMLENPNVESINIDENLITPAVFETIATLIVETEKTKLERLTLERTPIGDRGSRSLKRIMECNSTIRYLRIGENAMSKEAVASLVKQAKKKRHQYLFELSGHGTATERPEIPKEESKDQPQVHTGRRPLKRARVSSDEENKSPKPSMTRAAFSHPQALNRIPQKQSLGLRKALSFPGKKIPSVIGNSNWKHDTAADQEELTSSSRATKKRKNPFQTHQYTSILAAGFHQGVKTPCQ